MSTQPKSSASARRPSSSRRRPTRRSAALQLAGAVTEVTDLASQTAAAQALATVKGLADQVEQSRKIVKDPVLKIGKEIDSTASTFTTELTIEARRLSLLVGNFQDAERRKAQQAAEATCKAEQQRIEQQKAEERARAGLEVKGRTGTLSQDLQQIQTRAAADVAQIRQAGINAAVVAPTGTTVRKSWKFEVTDVQALFSGEPDALHDRAQQRRHPCGDRPQPKTSPACGSGPRRPRS